MNPKKVVRKVIPARGVKLAEESYRRSRLLVTQARYRFPARDMRIIAVTGTNGKTTTCMFINAMLKNAGYKTAMLTTAVYEMAGDARPNHNHRTVPVTSELFAFFREAKAKQVDFVIMEATSQALHQHKLRGLPIEVAVMTNISQDHLDYHGTMHEYALAKSRLFGRYMNPNYTVLNKDDEWFAFFRKRNVGVLSTYGRDKQSDIRIQRVSSTSTGSSCSLIIDGTSQAVQVHLPGLFNVYNAAAAAGVGQWLGLSGPDIAAGLASLTASPGRMESIDAGQPFAVIVDYAHAPDALENALSALRDSTKGKLSIVFGATGDRDQSKRPLMGEIAARLADRVYLTDDETYTEDPKTIRNDVLAGVKTAKGLKKTEVIPDREEAIKTAFAAAKKGDTVLLAGIGHQNSRNMGGKEVKWDERTVAHKLLNLLD
jgi:UDP-N-acetylmuramoyl-L-alanyl-D-glutamate--2,6-diaminopimelate ligase